MSTLMSNLPETQTLLTPGKDYTLSDNSLGRIAVTVPNMNQQKPILYRLIEQFI